MSKTFWKRLAAGALSLCLLTALTACGGGLTEKDAETYVKGYLDAAYLGSYDQAYIDLVEDMTMDDAKQDHRDYVEIEAQNMLIFLEVDYPTDEVVSAAEELMEEIYSRAQYKVAPASKTKDSDFVIEVTVSPIELFSLLSDEDFFEALDEAGFNEAETEEELEASDAIYGPLMLEKVKALLPQLTYGEDQVIMLHLKADDDGYYSLVETGMDTLDKSVIDYLGSYMK